MQLFFDENLNFESSTFLIESDESKHILRVLRKNIGDEIYVTNGKGKACRAEITNSISKRCEIKILDKHEEPPLPYQLHIAIAPTKSSDRFEYFLEKSTEIGISEITPLLCDNSERKRLNIKRCQKIIQSAMKQSQRFHLPKLHEMQSYNSFMQSNFEGYNTCIAHCEDHKKSPFKNQIRTSNQTLILIGPEGDFSTDEIQLALSKSFHPVTLGEKRLRTETAGIVASVMASLC
jgi:16S rRNA (uracil1498-N3)-methyltransferase